MNGFLTEILQAHHQKKDFDCGIEPLNRYLARQAKQDIKRKLSVCYVMADEAAKVVGFYTLSNAGILQKLLPEEIVKRMPPAYSSLPVTLLGRLAVDTQSKGKGIGKLLLIDGLKRSFMVSHHIGSMAVVVDPKEETAIQFYEKFGFILLPDSGKMFLPMKTIGRLFGGFH